MVIKTIKYNYLSDMVNFLKSISKNDIRKFHNSLLLADYFVTYLYFAFKLQ